MGFFDNLKDLKDKAVDKILIRDEEYDKEENTGEVGYAAENSQQSADENDITPPPYNSYSYSPTGGLDAPEYDFSSNRSYKSTPEFKFTKANATESAPAAAPASEFKFSADKKSANIYSMNSIRTLNKFKLNYITLKDIYGSKDVAVLMMEKDTIIVVDFSLLNEEQKLRAMDFIDGAKCVTNAIFGRLNDDIVVFVPENVELRGDFRSQVDFDSIL